MSFENIQEIKSLFGYWGLFGFKLGRLEFLWNGDTPETKEALPDAKSELLFMLDNAFEPNEKDFPHFSESILLYFLRENPNIQACILIGICIQRYQLGKICNSEYFVELSKQSLAPISKDSIPDKDILFSAICMADATDLSSIFSKVFEAFDIMHEETISEDEEKENRGKSKNHEKYVFISYSTKDTELVKYAKNQFEKNNIKCWMAPASIPVGSDYSEVIVDAIENSTAVVLILSDNSQTSVWVAKELDIALSASKTIIPIHIDKSNLKKGIRFRLSNSQICDAYDNFEEMIPMIVKTIKNIIVNE